MKIKHSIDHVRLFQAVEELDGFDAAATQRHRHRLVTSLYFAAKNENEVTASERGSVCRAEVRTTYIVIKFLNTAPLT